MAVAWTAADVVASLPRCDIAPLPVPPYSGRAGACVAMAVASMRDHMTDEGWQIMLGLHEAGYGLAGHDLQHNITEASSILRMLKPSTLVVQDKREWDVRHGDFRDPAARFRGVHILADHHDVFKLTIVKDAQNSPSYHADSAREMGVHAWIVYYNPTIVCALAPYIRREHVIRTYHTVDHAAVPEYSSRRDGALVSGALSSAYPLRIRLSKELPYRKHPGYHRNGCDTMEYMRALAGCRVAVCTSSRYGYALRKIVEATACGCAVVTDLPMDECMPLIDGNLHRVHPDDSTESILELVRGLVASYDAEKQRYYAALATRTYSYRSMCHYLAFQIESMRASWTT